MILAIDPGKDKCGLALFNKEGKVIEQRIIKRRELFKFIDHYHEATKLIIGDTANGREIERELQRHHPKATVVLFTERETTRLARAAYWLAHPPRGLWKLVPTSFRTPPVPVDDYAAAIIGRNYLASAQLRP
jgi:RNase H-fold protein (predicted Holliday junction resolvase)